MNEHCGESHSADELFSPTTIVSIASQFVTSALDEAGYKNASRVLRQWPKILGKKTAELLMNIFQKREEGKAITEEENSEFVEALREEPRDAAALLGLLAGNILAGTLDVKAERKLVLESYNVVFNLICSFLQKGTSVALKGFVHSEDCISYWHVAGRRPTFELADGEHLLPSTSLDVYLFFEDPTDTRVDELNRQIHKSRDRHLPPGEFDFGRNANVAKLVWVEETSLEIERLDPDGPAFKKDPIFDSFFGTEGIRSRPERYQLEIPVGAEPLLALRNSLDRAKRILLEHSTKLRETEKKVLEQRDE